MKVGTKHKMIADAVAWSARVNMPAYIYKTARGWKWTVDRRIAHMESATVETVDYSRRSRVVVE